MKAACTFSNTVSLGKMLGRWNERPMPILQMRCGGAPVMSRPWSTIWPSSGRRWPVIRLKKVDLPAPFGPITAAMLPWATDRLTPSTAVNPSKDLRTPRTSSIWIDLFKSAGGRRALPPAKARDQCFRGSGDAARKQEQQQDQDASHHERPVLRVGGDLLVQHDEGEGADRRAPEAPNSAQDRLDQRLGRLGPVGEVRKDAAVEDAEQRSGHASEEAGDDEGRQLIGPYVHADELGAFRIVANDRQHPSEGRG